jgi:hypothetical protein
MAETLYGSNDSVDSATILPSGILRRFSIAELNGALIEEVGGAQGPHVHEQEAERALVLAFAAGVPAQSAKVAVRPIDRQAAHNYADGARLPQLQRVVFVPLTEF